MNVYVAGNSYKQWVISPFAKDDKLWRPKINIYALYISLEILSITMAAIMIKECDVWQELSDCTM